MSNVIDFLESLGRDAALTPEAYARAVQGLDIDAELRDALLRKDRAALDRLLGARHNVMIALVPAEDDEDKDDGEGQDDDEVRRARGR
jgi:hypothetical protein